ncbi:MAG TPA: hypothetical protein PKK74_00860 [Candidatus Methanoculleus thermohydrogenotrophicum]|jgi:hypothetical protein|nr:hypothetical protein [Candidatus Methanoculleus thermohydrogenotrophicum]HOB17235.1 hypothetical protein [Candidatus Methanoculleus thermohydrogenotrophicum]HQC92144.1 hypothetical protein [Candidatus Methanoculleus thermohydrogenotrophicum]
MHSRYLTCVPLLPPGTENGVETHEKKNWNADILPLLLALLLVSVGIVPAVAATSEVPVEQPIPIVAANGQTSSGLHFVINEDVKETTSHWALFAADEQGQRNALNDLEMTQISDEKKQILSEGLRKIWAKYPVATIQRDGRTEVAFVSPGEHTLTEEEESILAQADEALAEYLNDKFSAENGIQWWAAPCHQDVIETSCLKWGVSSTYATYAHDAADDPDSWPSVLPPTGFEWLDTFIQMVCHSYDHYYDPVLGTGYAPEQCENYANTARNYYDQSSMYNAYTNLGYSSHFLTDVGNPLHTGMEIEQALNPWVHAEYEDYVGENWDQGSGEGYNFWSVIQDNWYYYTITDPSSSTQSLAEYAKNHDDELYYLVYNHRDTFRTDPDVRSITEDCLLDTAKYTLGLVKYVRD